MDRHTRDVRSYNMSRIRAAGTKLEEAVRKYLFSKGLRYRKNVRTLPGTPDIVLPKYKTVVFVNGCFWHGHENCRYFVMPETNANFWKEKISANAARDRAVNEKLSAQGWKICTVWECELKKPFRERTLEALYGKITQKQLLSGRDG